MAPGADSVPSVPPVPTHWGRGGGSGPGLRSRLRADGAVRGFRRSLAAPSSHMAEAPRASPGDGAGGPGKAGREGGRGFVLFLLLLPRARCRGRDSQPSEPPSGRGASCSDGALRGELAVPQPLHPSAAEGWRASKTALFVLLFPLKFYVSVGFWCVGKGRARGCAEWSPG